MNPSNAPPLRPAPLHGVVPPLVTPLTDAQTLDVDALERLVAHVLAGGVHGLFVLGTTGEAAALDDPVRAALVRHTCRLVAGRVPVLVGVTDTRVAESVRMARWAAECGADAVVVSTPFYLPLEQSELVSYVEGIVSQQPLPCFLYNIPALTKTAYEPDTVRRLADVPGVVGMKDSSGDLDYLLRLRDAVPRTDWSFFVGRESLLAQAVGRGVHGCIPGGANVAPALFVALYEAATRGDAARVAELQQRAALLSRVYRLAEGNASVIRGIKCALQLLGICGQQMGAPLRDSTPAEQRVIATCVRELGLAAPASVERPGVRTRGDARADVPPVRPGRAGRPLTAARQD